MLKKTITFTDFNGEETTEDHFFHLSQAELVELEMSVDGGFGETMKKIIAAGDNATIMKEFKRIILMSYGKKSEDGKRFIKNDELRQEFESSEAYSELFVELCTDAEAAGQFINGIIPPKLAAQAAKVREQTGDGTTSEVPGPSLHPRVQTITRAELEALSQEDFVNASEKIGRGELRVVSSTDLH